MGTTLRATASMRTLQGWLRTHYRNYSGYESQSYHTYEITTTFSMGITRRATKYYESICKLSTLH